MTRGKANNSNRYLRYVLSIAISFALANACLLSADVGVAQAQSPASVLNSVNEVADGGTLRVLTESDSQPTEGELAPVIEPPDLIILTPQDSSMEDLDSDPFLHALDAPSGNQPFRICSTGQSIRLRKNVIGCKGRYEVLPQDEIWIVSARASSCDPENVQLLEVKKFENSCWQASTLDALSIAHLNDTSRTTMLYVHGNQTNYEYGVSRGFQFYDNLFVKYECPRAPVRLVLWLWESDRELPRLYSDYLVKSRRAVSMGKTLTKTLDALGNRKVALVGFSLGAQVVLSSLDQMEAQCGYAGAFDQKGKYNVALIAPASDPKYVCDVARRNIKCKIVDKSSIIINSDDRAVKAMHFVIRNECPEARDDFAKLAKCKCLPLGETQFFEVSQEVSRKHSIRRYTKSPTMQREMGAVLNRTAAETF